MRYNPLFTKEFRQRMRTVRAPIVITGYVLCMVALTFFLLYENVQGQLYLVQPTKSQQVFVILSLLQMVVVAFLTPAFAAGSVSGERERKTLAVLLTTPLSPIGILVGKIVSSSALLVLLMFVTLPVYSLVFLYGGAVPQEVIAVLLFQLFTTVVIATLCVLFSTIALRSTWSTVLCYGTVSFMMIVFGALGYGLKLVYERNPIELFSLHWGNFLLSLNPLYVEATLEGEVSGNPHMWVTFAWFYTLVILILLFPSLWRLRPQWFSRLPFGKRATEKQYQ
ncbi:ABC transporter permease [Alicyclobacillus dauci]|uniref:ABC transporter permease n=1 Tax=Alicyclobacillus dauci TaxID=1475485 RepID=A0ABY6Z6J4_9BACL|nr:ABC transporter permease subunit [Alicyclobacillus dauci]WAH38490.1 ABC transporter permease [Alicyclobacillus dauci]